MFCNVFVEVDDACKGLTFYYDTTIINYIYVTTNEIMKST